MTEQIDTRKFSVSPHIIYSLIKAQAGTLAKGLLECVMNSVDANATQVDIVLNTKSMTVTDNGKGFQSRAEIEACFEVFGFEHKEGDRSYGQFGIGRAQLWNFASTIWHTNQFRMDVDIKNRGLDYDLVEHSKPVKGLVIEGTFYEPMSTSEVLACERELKELAMYVSVPVTFNGKRISKDPAEQKWTHETEDAWIHLNSSSNSLTVYNLGVKVRDYSSWQFGCGGLVVTKPGVRLSLNMARNDIVTTECKVWKRIRPFLQKKSDEAVKRSPRITEDQVANMCTRLLAGEMDFEDISQRKLVVDVLGNKYTLDAFFDKAFETTDRVVTYASREDAGPVNEQAHRSGFCFVLGHQTLARFGVNSLTELMEKLRDTLEREAPQAFQRLFRKEGWRSRDNPELVIVDDWRKACKRVVNGYTEVPHKDWTKREQAAIAALSAVSGHVPRILRQSGLAEGKGVTREIRIGVSEIAKAWTDGTNIIWVNREQLAFLDEGMAGAWSLFGIMMHEYLHEEPSTGTHAHDLEFYKRFHDFTTFISPEWPAASQGYMAQEALRLYAKECSKRGVPIKQKVLKALDTVEQFLVAA